ncbi:hypothetical protein ABPG74_019132 [Tetrahymena malaccensis]
MIERERTIRKQFVCYLILRFFESYGQFQNPSFYELWNFCFPEQAQIKKKLSRYDSKEKYQNNRFSSPNKSNESCQNSNILINFEAEPNFSDELCGLNQQYMATCSQSYVYNNIIDNHIPQLTNQQLSQQCQSTNFKAQKKQINNGIISEDEDDDDYQLVSLTKNNLFSQSFYLEKSNSFKNQQQLQKYSEDYNIWYPQLDQKQFYQRNEFQNFSQEKQQAIRKQLVCYLILRFFETYGQFEVPSFYELWNLCFPEELQKKKRLTRFDKKNTNSTQKITIKNESSSNYEYSIQSSSDLSNINQIPYLNQESSQNLQASIIIDSNNICSLDQSQINIQEPASENQQVAFSNQKKQINNGIIEEDDSDDEETSVFSYTPKVNFSQPFQPTQQPYSNKNDRYLNIEKIQISEQYQYLSLQSDQNQFFYQNEHYEQLFDNYELNQYQLIQNQTNYQINQDSYDFPLYQNYY